MNVFVLSTGRCGSTSFIKACRHITNYSSAHESRTALLGKDRLNYPSNHIEADNRLSWLLGRLDRQYSNSAVYVHLKRNDKDTANSFTKRYASGIIKAYRGSGILIGLPENTEPFSVAIDYCNTVNSNIELFLKDKSNRIVIDLEKIDQDFKEFWHRIKAEGDISAALAEFNIKHNATAMPQASSEKGLLVRIISKLRRVVIKFPEYIKNV